MTKITNSDDGKDISASASVLVPSSGRLHYLDALRSFCMLFGLFVHANTLDRLEWLGFIPFISDQFRMATFFAVSAILSTLVLQKRPEGLFVRKRLVALVVPFMAGVLLLNPMTLWLIWQIHGQQAEPFGAILSMSLVNGDETSPSNLVWHLHLWFLVSLTIYAMMTPALNRFLGSAGVDRVLGTLLHRTPAALRVILIACSAAAVAMLLRIVGEVLFPQLYDWWLTRATLLNITFFITGVLIARFSELRSIGFDTISVLLTVLLVVILWLDIISNDSSTGKVIHLLISQVVNVCAIFFLIFIFRKFASNPSRIGSLLINSIYTVYLFHYLFIYIVGNLFIGTDVSRYVVYLVAVILSFISGLITHRIVSGVPLLSWIFNGKPLRQPVGTADTT